MSIFNSGIFGNCFQSAILFEKKSDKDLYIASIKTDLGIYDLKVSLKHDKLIITSESEIEFLSIYSYSKELSLEELKKLSNNFKSCENIEQGFTIFINILKGISLSINNKDYKSKFKVEFSDDDSLTLKLTIPLMYEKYETIEIIFERNKKDLFEQYRTLRSKYLKVKELISDHRCDSKHYKNSESLSTKIQNIEKEKKINIFENEKKETINLFTNLTETKDTDNKKDEMKEGTNKSLFG